MKLNSNQHLEIKDKGANNNYRDFLIILSSLSTPNKFHIRAAVSLVKHLKHLENNYFVEGD